jgi:hypothetical protein
MCDRYTYPVHTYGERRNGWVTPYSTENLLGEEISVRG